MDTIIESFGINPIIAAIRQYSDLEYAINSPISVIFLLYGDIFNIKELVDTIKKQDKKVFIHIDFIEGIGKDVKAIEYIIQEIKPNGIISTKSSHIRYAREQGAYTIQRFFIIDSQSYNTAIKTVKSVKPHMIEILPGIMPTILKKMNSDISLPIIAGGLIKNKQDIMDILNAGAIAASTAKKELWQL